MEIVLAIINAALLWAVWFFLGRGSIYAKLIKELREALEVIGAQETMIQAYKMKYNTEKRRKKMENKINIAEILRDMPKGTKLYSPLFGKCELGEISNDNKCPILIIVQKAAGRVVETLMKDGSYFEGFEDTDTMIFPSVEMRSWDKFFKRGDVVFNESSGLVAVFDGWVNDGYAEFNTTINLITKGDFWGEEEVCDTECFSKVTDEERAEFISSS